MPNVPTVSNKEAVILGAMIAARKDTYGLDIVKRTKGAVTRNTVYVYLQRMTKKGFVTPVAGTAGELRMYRVTGLGKQAHKSHKALARYWAKES